jgi:hypothetical protein
VRKGLGEGGRGPGREKASVRRDSDGVSPDGELESDNDAAEDERLGRLHTRTRKRNKLID